MFSGLLVFKSRLFFFCESINRDLEILRDFKALGQFVGLWESSGQSRICEILHNFLNHFLVWGFGRSSPVLYGYWQTGKAF